MIQVQFMKPFYTKVTGKTLRLVFAYQYFSIVKDDELFHFIPTEGKEMLIDLNTRQVENLSDIFVFQRGNRFIRLPLYQLLLISNIQEHLSPIINNAIGSDTKNESLKQEKVVVSEDISDFITELENRNIDYYIDLALDERNEELFKQLLDMKKELINN